MVLIETPLNTRELLALQRFGKYFSISHHGVFVLMLFGFFVFFVLFFFVFFLRIRQRRQFIFKFILVSVECEMFVCTFCNSLSSSLFATDARPKLAKINLAVYILLICGVVETT